MTSPFIIPNKELSSLNKSKVKHSTDLKIASKERLNQKKEKISRASVQLIVNPALSFQKNDKVQSLSTLIIANKKLNNRIAQTEKRSAELNIVNKGLSIQKKENDKYLDDLIKANKKLASQNEEYGKQLNKLITTNRELVFQNSDKGKRAGQLLIANKAISFQKRENEKRSDELLIANKELAFQSSEKGKRADELSIANQELAFQNNEKINRTAELLSANTEISFQNNEKQKRADELTVANKELNFQNSEKEKRADELNIANKELAYQNSEKEKRAKELMLANHELAFQNSEKENRAKELVLANNELAFQNSEKEKRASELLTAIKNLSFESKEKERLADELIIVNKELAFQNTEKHKRSDELIVATGEIAFQNSEKANRAAELAVANMELSFQNNEKEKRANELIIVNKELAYQHSERTIRADELVVAIKELAFQNTEKEKRANELTIINEKLIKSEANLNKLNERLEEIVAERTSALLESIKETIKANQDKEGALNRISDGVISLDNDWRYTFLNDAALSSIPHGKEATLGKVIWEVYPELNGTIFRDKFQEAMLTKMVSEFESYYAPTDMWLCVNLYPSSDGLTIYTKDVTKRKLIDQQLEQSRKEVSDYKYALEESSIVVITDQKGIIKYVNANFCEISKYSAEELIGQDHRIINSGYHSKEFIRSLWTTIAGGKIWRGEIKNRAKDGSSYWVNTTIVPFLNENGNPYKYLALRSDITLRKQAEERIQKMNEELEEKVAARTSELTESLAKEKVLNEMKSRFVSLASHEFRTPLSTILSSVSLIASYNSDNQQEKRTKHINRITSSVKDLTGILNDFLSLDKLEQGDTILNTEFFDLAEFANEILEEVNLMLKPGQHINYSYSGGKGLHQDQKVIKNILLNLLSNAIKYSADNKEIQLCITVDNNVVSLQVLDEGIGIPEDEQQYLFQKFYRAKNATHIQGTGLGLTIVKKYVELLGGSIDFKSKHNQGSSFIVEFQQFNQQ